MDVKAQTPTYEYAIDSLTYDLKNKGDYYFFPSPNTQVILFNSSISSGYYLFACRKKNTEQFDIFSFGGKIGTVTIPNTIGSIINVLLSQTFIDEDAEWESIVDYHLPQDTRNLFKVLDGNGVVLLSDTGSGRYGFDGQNTYVVTQSESALKTTVKAWRFRTNVSVASPNTLAKSASAIPHAMMTYGPTGDYRVTIAPTGGGKTSVQVFDMLGRTVFSKNIDNIISPVSFTIPERGLPQSPFIAKVKDEKGMVVKREIPIK
jgi:hypothetical protein